MNVFLGHIAVHYLPGGDRAWLILALLGYGGYATALSLWLRARTVEAEQGLAPGIGIGGRAVIRPQLDPRTTPLAHEHAGPVDALSPVFVLLHGLGATASFWEPVTSRLAASGARSLAPHLLGHGASIRIGTQFTVDDQAQAVIGLLTEHHLRAVRLVAHSYGCAVAVEVATRAPALVVDVTLISPPAFVDPAVARMRLGSRSWLARRTIAGAPIASAACGLMCLLRAPLSRLAPRVEPTVPAAVARGAVLHSFPAYRDGLDTLFVDNPLPGWLATPTVPTRLVLADQDEDVPTSDVLALPGVERLALLRHAGTHRLPLEQPAWVAAQLLTPTARPRR